MKTYSVKNISEVPALLAKMDERSKFIGGGTDLIMRVHNSPETISSLYYLGYVKEYKEISFDGEVIKIGAFATMSEIQHNPDVIKHFPALMDACSNVGSLQIRNRGTIGGNVGNAAPSADLLPVLDLYDAVFEVTGPNGIRLVNFKDYLVGPGKTSFSYNEAVTAVIINKPKFDSAFLKLGSRKKVTIARMALALGINIDAADLVSDVKLIVGAIGIKPVTFDKVSEFLVGKPINDYNISEVAKILSAYIKENVPAEFDRDYKVYASIGAVTDLFDKLNR